MTLRLTNTSRITGHASSPHPSSRITHHASCQSGSILVLVLWISFGLVAIALYFAHAMAVELQAADNRVASIEAEQAIEGGALYVSNILATMPTPHTLPNSYNFLPAGRDGLGTKVGNARFWLIGRDTNFVQTTTVPDHPYWGLVDEASKLNLNTATTNQLLWLPYVDEYLAEYIYEWRTNTYNSVDLYSSLQVPYTAKLTNYETVDELRLVYNMNLDLLYGEDANLNGILDPNENDGDDLPPHDNRDSHLDSGLLDLLTVYTHEGNTTSNGLTRVLVSDTAGVKDLFSNSFPQFNGVLTPFQTTAAANVMDFYLRSGMSVSDFETVEPLLMNPITNGLVNVNTANANVLSAILGTNLAAQLLTYRESTPPITPTISWVKDALGSDTATLTRIGAFITPYTFQYTADIAAVGHNGRGYRRVKFVFDVSSGVPQIIYRQDLTHLGWALGKSLFDQLHPIFT